MGTQERNNPALKRLRQKLQAVQWRMNSHILGSGPVADSLALIKKMRAQNATDHQIDTALQSKGLPSVVQVGYRSVLHLPSWWWLKRKKKRLERAISRHKSGA